MKEWFTIPELAAHKLPGLPQTQQGMDLLAKNSGWKHIEGKARKAERRGGGWEYHIDLLPQSARTRLLVVHSAPANDDRDAEAEKKAALWARFNALSEDIKAECEKRLEVLTFVEELLRAGVTVDMESALKVAVRKYGVSRASIYNWRAQVHHVSRADWLAALAPSSTASKQLSECSQDAWDFLMSDYLRPERPSFSACYRRMVKVAKKEKWTPIPSERALRRRLDAEVPAEVQTLARDGKEKAKTLYPAQRRSRANLHAMQMVNMDGHKLDLFVKVPWSDEPVRMFLLGIQDLYSGKILSWRLSESENKETVRLVIGDMVENFGIPEGIVLDNGRAFTSKWISGGAENRYRFKVKDEDPRGLLTTLGVEIHWTNPFSGQSKPIERAWRDLAENISKHPFSAGAYTGNTPANKPENYGTRVIPLAELHMHVSAQVAEHNAQPGRRAANCAGRSFDETFAASMETAIVSQPTAAQKSLWLLASEVIRTQKGNGEIHYQGNRYWNSALTQHAGKKITIRFDPDDLHGSIKVYDLNNALICDAECIADTGFFDQDAARNHARARRDYLKGLKATADAQKKLSAKQLGELIYKGEKARTEEPKPVRPKVTRIARGNLAMKEEAVADAISQEDFERGFARALRGDEPTVIQFPQGKHEPVSSEYGSKKKGGRNPAR
ncbi:MULTISPECIES: transposase domain-containing protein [unclassified Brucella]|uniref:transposase domain-containing protein n=1 Tax=unclassified Brucella TaxID=2632610 RepID=UPI0001E44409|nr:MULTISPECIES: transposase domain-containing protein [unclassified Brucella]EFM58334.1 class III transposase [Brucella sp. BO2]QGA56321.1 DDE-type integrase/transposase/recombinase [Brucella sp. 2280]QPN28838.1 Mu transposase C-terminal domain-containing protein [Brucella sp. BO2]